MATVARRWPSAGGRGGGRWRLWATGLVLLGGIVAAGCRHGAASSALPAVRRPELGQPAVPGASFFGAVVPAQGADPLREAILAEAGALALQRGAAVPIHDPALDGLARSLVDLGPEELPSYDLLDFLMGYHGLPDPHPHLVVVREAGGADADARGRVAGELPALLTPGRVLRMGVGLARDPDALRIVVALLERSVEIEPVPRRVEPGAQTRLAGRLMAGLTEPRVIVTGPDGAVTERPVAGGPTGFSSSVTCDRGVGRYRVEITGADAAGSAVVANFTLHCGEDPPTAPPRAQTGTRTVEPGAAERVMVELVNRERAAAGLPVVTWSEPLAAVARAHSRDMAEHDFVAHVSPSTGNALDRVRRVGLDPPTLAENVVRASSAEEAHRGLMMSPGHRENVLDPRVRRIGIGVVPAASVGGVVALYVTQLFSD